MTLPDGEAVVLHGYADRLEVDDDGHVVVVDLKTGKYPPTDKSLVENPQLGLYQHAVNNGALDEVAGEPPVGWRRAVAAATRTPAACSRCSSRHRRPRVTTACCRSSGS